MHVKKNICSSYRPAGRFRKSVKLQLIIERMQESLVNNYYELLSMIEHAFECVYNMLQWSLVYWCILQTSILYHWLLYYCEFSSTYHMLLLDYNYMYMYSRIAFNKMQWGLVIIIILCCKCNMYWCCHVIMCNQYSNGVIILCHSLWYLKVE